MSRKHNTPHQERGRSRYRARLSRRGVKASSVRMDDLETLRQRQRRSLPAGTLAEYDQRAETLLKGSARPGWQDDHDQGDF